MAFPVVLQGPDTEHRNDYAEQRWLLGQKLITGDGRAYRFVQVGSATLVPGNVIDGPGLITNHEKTAGVVAGSEAGSSTLVATLGSTASAKNQYRGGYASIVLTPGGGETYLLNSEPSVTTHEAVDSAGIITANLAQGETIVTALTATSDVTWVLNRYKGVVQSPVTTLLGEAVGVAVKATTANRYGWVQTAGVASVLASGTVVVGNTLARLVAAAGAAGPTAVGTEAYLGRVVSVGTTWATVVLDLD
jgi:hypothetical protein|tara:strand:+ start:216 stop:959 length:744 start_codon:yes stop_codon:yes gene_type:complete